MGHKYCSVEVRDSILTVTLSRVDQRNALHADANHELGEVFDHFENDPSLRVAILTGEGEAAFCAGADLASPMTGNRNRSMVPKSGFAGLTSRFDRRKPVVAAMNGYAMGGGFEAALACDIIVAAEHATMGLTEPRVGLAALGGGIQRLMQEIAPKQAHSMLLTGRKISAKEAASMGLVAEVVEKEHLLDTANKWAEEILMCSPASIAATKAVLRSLDGCSVQQSMEDMLKLPEVKSLFLGPDAKEGPVAFKEKRPPRWADLH